MPHNNMHGLLPATLPQLSYLTTLELSDNALVGTIPETLFQLPDLFSMYVAWRGSLQRVPVGGADATRPQLPVAQRLPRLDPARWLRSVKTVRGRRSPCEELTRC